MWNLAKGLSGMVTPVVVAAGMLGLVAQDAAAFEKPEFLRNLRIGVHIGSGSVGVHVDKGHDHRHVHNKHCRHHSGHHVWREQRVLVREAYCQTVYVPPVYETYCDRRGREHRVVVHEGYYKKIEHPAVYETRKVKVFVPERWECDGRGYDRHDRDRHDDDRGRGRHWKG